jgi:Mn-dependent transcriptional regulator
MTAVTRYLRAIYAISQREGAPVSTGAIAEALEVTPASVSEMLPKLADAGLIDHEKYTGVTLTDPGIAAAGDALETYCIIERFVGDVLNLDDIVDEAQQLDGVIHRGVAERLDMLVDRRPECPECFDPARDRCQYLADD